MPEIPRRIVDEALFCDLAMVPLSEAVAIEQDTAEQLVLSMVTRGSENSFLAARPRAFSAAPNVGAPFSLGGRLDMKLRGRWWRVPNSHSKRSTTIAMIASSAELRTNSRLHGSVRAL